MQCVGPLACVFVTWLYFSQRGRLDEAAAVKKKKRCCSSEAQPANEKERPVGRSIHSYFIP
jgi:hypothetical protein